MTPHKEKLDAALRNPKCGRNDIDLLNQAILFYTEWRAQGSAPSDETTDVCCMRSTAAQDALLRPPDARRIRYPFSANVIAPNDPVHPGWSWVRLNDVARLATGHTPSRRVAEYWDGDIPWLQLPDIRALDGKVAEDTIEHTNQAGINNSAAVLLPKGTVCLSRTASVGFVTIMGRPMATSQDFVNWVCGPELCPDFLMHLFLACRGSIRALGSGAVHNTIYFPTVEQFSICMPPREEQEHFVDQVKSNLEKATQVIEAIRSQLRDAEALPAAVLRTAFTELK